MTITLYLEKSRLLEDTKLLYLIFQAGNPKFAEPLSKVLKPIKVFTSKNDLNVCSPVAIQVTLEEFALIGIFNGGI
jgi:hypothetical protein